MAWPLCEQFSQNGQIRKNFKLLEYRHISLIVCTCATAVPNQIKSNQVHGCKRGEKPAINQFLRGSPP